MNFDRWKSQDDYTYAYKIFNRYHTYMNSLYWSYAPAFVNSQIMYSKTKKEYGPLPTTHHLFNLSGSNSERVASNLDDWSRHFKEFDNWTRLNALLSLNSYFEIYLSSVVSLAVESDIGLQFSASKSVDGLTIVKNGNPKRYSFFDISKEITMGEWSKRRKRFKEIFGSAPQELTTYEKDLETIRSIRNRVAHSFGRDIEKSRSRSQTDILEIERISLKRLQKFMSIIRTVARSIDEQLLNNHIGDYEAVFYYHEIKGNLPVNNHVKGFKKELNSLYVKQKSALYCEELIDYYNSL
ncbi:hypothetical protein [Peribacillus simplex]|uniref:hypothetical protein n=1 Tax=Peribacillus simplex TaxID=1478 RepID=UPI0011A18199|nr:hypothetical protein [Peribacillus simplex]